MSRRKASKKREVAPDSVYNNQVVSKFINCMMKHGKKEISEKIFYEAMNIIQKEQKQQPLDVFFKALENTSPKSEVKSRRVGGATYQVPIDVEEARGRTLAIRWLISSARERKGEAMMNRLAKELVAAANEMGNAFKKKEEIHKLAKSNLAFSHYRW